MAIRYIKQNYESKVEEYEKLNYKSDKGITQQPGKKGWKWLGAWTKGLSGYERFTLFLKVFVMTVGTLGFSLISKSVREQWQELIAQKKIRIIYVPSGEVERTDQLASAIQPPTSAKKFSWHSTEVQANYRKLMEEGKIAVLRDETTFVDMADKGGAANVGFTVFERDPSAKIGVVIAANSGLPGGALGHRPGAVTAKDLKMTTQEEAVWANAVLTACGVDATKQLGFHERTIKDKWGLVSPGGISTATIQGIDFTTSEHASDYNQAYLLRGNLSFLDDHKEIVLGKAYPVLFAFADSVNANAGIGTPAGSMQRTLNKKAIHDYAFFRECIKEKLRSALDGMASEGVTHPLVALLSCGIYAGKHQGRIKKDFYTILQEVLNEKVGPHGEPRGCFFKEVIIPKLPH